MNGGRYNTMEILESATYIALGFIPTLALLEIVYRLGVKLRRKKGIERGHLTNNKVTIANCFQEINKMDIASVSIRKYFSK